MHKLIKVSLSIIALSFSSSALAQGNDICPTVMPQAAALTSDGSFGIRFGSSFDGSGQPRPLFENFHDVSGSDCFASDAVRMMRVACENFLAPVHTLPVLDNPSSPSCEVEQGAITKLAKEVNKLRRKLRRSRSVRVQ